MSYILGQQAGQVSIHAPARGATQWLDNSGNELNGFNPRTRKGCDDHQPGIVRELNSFNPRTRKGCD